MAKGSIVGLRFEAGRWELITKGGDVLSADIRPNYLVTRYLMILNFKVSGWLCPRAVVLLPNSANKDQLRECRVVLL